MDCRGFETSLIGWNCTSSSYQDFDVFSDPSDLIDPSTIPFTDCSDINNNNNNSTDDNKIEKDNDNKSTNCDNKISPKSVSFNFNRAKSSFFSGAYNGSGILVNNTQPKTLDLDLSESCPPVFPSKGPSSSAASILSEYIFNIIMKFRTCVAILLFVFVIVVYVFEPWPSTVVMDYISPSCTSILYAVLLLISAGLLWSTFPKPRVDPAGKAVFITGCDSGFGNELARRLDSEGYHVFAGCLAPDREGAQNLKQAASDRLHIVPVDVTDDFQVSQAVRYVKENIGDNQLWSIVNNAGVAVFCEIEWCSVQEFMKIMDVNVFGIVRVTKGFLPLLRQSEGRVINVASLAGRFTLPAFAAYSMSKKACIAFSDALRQEMKKFNIKVITIEPGLYKTPISGESYLIDYNRKSWAATPTEVKEDYGEEYFDAFLEQVSISLRQARSNVQEVVDNMIEAVCAKNPSHRYVPYWRNSIRAFIIGSLPVFLTDKLFARRFPVKQPVARKSSKSPKTPKTPTGSTRIPSKIPIIRENSQS